LYHLYFVVVYNKSMDHIWDIEDKELGQKCIDEVIARVQDIDDTEAVGIIAAQDIIDIVLENAGPEIYNRALKDVHKVISEKFQDIEYDIEELQQTP
jgi:uncharacterized protein (DUF2164 family)